LGRILRDEEKRKQVVGAVVGRALKLVYHEGE